MKSIVEVEINKPQREVASLFANPANNPKWMLDLGGYEPLSGTQGMTGSTYRLLPKKGKMIFIATVISSNLPHELKLELVASNVSVSVKGTLIALTPSKTKLVSEEIFVFKGFFNSIFSLLATKTIRSIHRQHICDFKSFAENY